jgi:hypothetical protein
MWLALCGCQAAQRKLKKGIKTLNMHFYPIFELTSDSRINLSYSPYSMKFSQNILRIGGVKISVFFE